MLILLWWRSQEKSVWSAPLVAKSFPTGQGGCSMQRRKTAQGRPKLSFPATSVEKYSLGKTTSGNTSRLTQEVGPAEGNYWNLLQSWNLALAGRFILATSVEKSLGVGQQWYSIWRVTTSRQHNLKSMKAKKQCFSCHSGLCLLEFLGSWKFPQHTCSYFVQYASSFREQIGKYLFILYKLWKTFTKKITVADDAVYMW